MNLLPFLTLLIATTATTLATPLLQNHHRRVTDNSLQITHLTLTQSHPGNTTLTFTLHDPQPLSNTTAPCGATWTSNTTNYPSGDLYAVCGNRSSNSTFAWKFDDSGFAGAAEDFVLDFEHAFENLGVGQPPYDHQTNFYKGSVSSTLLECQDAGAKTVCTEKDGEVIHAPVYATIAKK